MSVEFDFDLKVIKITGEFVSFKELSKICKGKENWKVIANDVMLVIKETTQPLYLTPGVYQTGTGEFIPNWTTPCSN